MMEYALVALAGLAAGAATYICVSSAVRRQSAMLLFGLICIAFASYLTLQAAVFSTADVVRAARLLRFQGVAAAAEAW